MSWQEYVDSSLKGSGVVAHAAILGSSDGSIWAKDENFNVRPRARRTARRRPSAAHRSSAGTRAPARRRASRARAPGGGFCVTHATRNERPRS